MQLFAGVIKIKPFVYLAPLLGMMGCADIAQTGSTPPIPTNRTATIEKDAAGRYFQDPVAGFAIANVPGSVGPVQLSDRKIYQVSVGGDYIAVTGEACRDVILVPPSGAATKSSVCRIKGIWRAISLP